MSFLSIWPSFLVILVLLKLPWRSKKSPTSLPPGPPAEFLLGHARIFPREQPQYKLAQWAKKYGKELFLSYPEGG